MDSGENDVSATEAARNFAELIGRARHKGESFVITKGKEKMARIVPAEPTTCTVGQLIAALERAPRPDEEYLRSVEDAQKKQPKLPKSPWGR